MKKIFLLILLAQIIIFLVTPPFQIPDEPGHYENVIWLSKGKYPYQVLEKNKQYPYIVKEIEQYYQTKFDFKKVINNPLKNKKQTDFEKTIDKNYQPINFQAYHPFFYYLLLTPGQFLANILKVNLITRFYLTRLISALLFWILIFSIYKILKIYKVNQENIKTFFLFYGLNPIIIYYSIGINPDLGVAIFSTFFLFLSIKFKENLSYSKLIILGFFAGLSYLNKTSGLTVLIYSLFYFLTLKKNLISKLKKGFIFILIYLITISPWLILSFSRYRTLTTPAFYIAHQGPIRPKSYLQSIIPALLEFRHTFMHYSGFLGAQNHLWPNKIYFTIFTFALVFFFLIGLLKYLKKYFLLSLYLTANFFFFYFLSFYFKKAGFLWDLQGRYFLLAFFPFYFFVYLGIVNLFKSKSVYLLIRLFSILNFLGILFFLLIPNFYPKINIIYALNILYPFFGYFFVFFLILFFIRLFL